MSASQEKLLPSARLSLSILLMLFASVIALGQDRSAAQPVVPPDSQVSEVKSEIARLLASDREQDRAWAAYFIAKLNLREYTPMLFDLLDHPAEMYLVRRAAIDSLIQLDSAVPADVLMKAIKDFKDEAIILLAKSPEENKAVLLSLAKEIKSGIRWAAVCNLLAEIKAPGFAAYLLKDLKINVRIDVSDNGTIGSGAGSGWGVTGCGGSAPPTEGYPPLFYYMLTDHASRGAVVVAPGKRTIYYQRLEGERRVGYSDSGGDNDYERFQYLAALLGVTNILDLRLHPFQSFSIAWKSAAVYKRELSNIRNQVIYSHNGLIGQLIVNGLLTEDETQTLKPNMHFVISDHRNNQSVALPAISMK